MIIAKNMLNKKRITYISLVLIIAFFVFFGPRIKNYIGWEMTEAVIATGGFTYPIGLNNPSEIPCFTTGSPPVCTGGTMCYTLDPGRCTFYSDVSGVQAGGAGSMALLQKTALRTAGITPAGGLIAAGTGPTLMDSGPLAGPGGCYNCFTKENFLRVVKDKIKYIIAGFKND